MREHKALVPSPLNKLMQRLVTHLLHFAALGTDLMVVGEAAVATLIQGVVTKLVFDHQMGVLKNRDCVVECRATEAKIRHVGLPFGEGAHVNRGCEGVDGIEYSIAFGRLAMSVQVEIFREYLLDHLLDFLTIHGSNLHFTAYKVNCFLWNANQKERLFRKILANFLLYELIKLLFGLI